MRNRERNLDQLQLAAKELEPLLERIVFLGGCTTGLFITDPAAADIRPTLDVDVIVEIGDLGEYRELEAELRKAGFGPSMDEDAPICRWLKDEVVADVMPTNESILGFGARWYPDAIRTADIVDLDHGLKISVVNSVMFVATKIEAFEGRGKGDFYGSQDIEDLVAVVDGRPELVDEVMSSVPELQAFIREYLSRYMQSNEFINALPGFVPGFHDSPARENIIRARLEALCRYSAI